MALVPEVVQNADGKEGEGGFIQYSSFSIYNRSWKVYTFDK